MDSCINWKLIKSPITFHYFSTSSTQQWFQEFGH